MNMKMMVHKTKYGTKRYSLFLQTATNTKKNHLINFEWICKCLTLSIISQKEGLGFSRSVYFILAWLGLTVYFHFINHQSDSQFYYEKKNSKTGNTNCSHCHTSFSVHSPLLWTISPLRNTKQKRWSKWNVRYGDLAWNMNEQWQSFDKEHCSTKRDIYRWAAS